MKKCFIVFVLFTFSLTLLIAHHKGPEAVSMSRKDGYYQVTIDYTLGKASYDIGVEYGWKMQIVNPFFELEIDQYLRETSFILALSQDLLLSRCKELIPQIPANIREEIQGMASTFNGKRDYFGDGVLTLNELYCYNLLIELLGVPSCSMVSVYGDRSATGNTIIGRNYDWFAGLSIVDLCNSVTFLKYEDKTICDVSWLGFLGVHTGFTTDGLYAAYTWSGMKVPYVAEGRYSIVMSIRSALEESSTYYGIVDFLGDEKRKYPFDNNILIADNSVSNVLENNFSSPDTTTIRRELRNCYSELNPGVTWGYDNSICVVNSFILKGNHDNHTGEISNNLRWNNFRTQLGQKGSKVTFEDVRDIMSYVDPVDSWGDIYKMRPNFLFGDVFPTMQVVIYEMGANRLECYFQKTSLPDTVPRYKKVIVEF